MKSARALLLPAVILFLLLAGCDLPYSSSPVDPGHVRVIVNPYGVAPLSAIIVISQAAGITEKSVHRVVVTVKEPPGAGSRWELSYGSKAYMANFDTSDLDGIAPGDVVVPVLGLAPDAPTDVSTEIYDDGPRRKYVHEARITAALETDTTDPLRDGWPDISIVTPPASGERPDATLVSFSMGNNGRFMTRPFIMDSRGSIRWVLRLDELVNWASPVEALSNGNLVLGRGGYVYEYSLLGRQVHAWDIARYGYTQHHDIVQITRGPHKGNLLVAVDRIGADTVEDFIIEIDPAGLLVETWDLRQVLDVTRSDVLKNPADWLHMNALLYDARDDTLVISGRNQGVAKVGRDNDLRWILAPHQGWGPAGVSGDGLDTTSFLLTPVSASGKPFPPEVQQGTANVDEGRTFDWPWGQHAVELLPNGNLLLFDNGFNRLFQAQRASYSRAVEYRIDERNRQVRQVWQYGAERGADYYSDIISDVDAIPGTKSRLVTSGSIRNSPNGPHAYVTEITYPEGKVLFETRIGFKDAHSNLKAGGWGNIDIVYRAERMPLYPGTAGRGVP